MGPGTHQVRIEQNATNTDGDNDTSLMFPAVTITARVHLL
jgi:hypothetical protein